LSKYAFASSTESNVSPLRSQSSGSSPVALAHGRWRALLGVA